MELDRSSQTTPGLSLLSSFGKIVLIVLTVLSFNPLLQRLQDLGESTGISLFYLLINLIVATEQLTIGILLIAYDVGVDGVSHDPPTPGDWLNLLQFAAVWLSHFVLWLYCLNLAPPRSGQKKAVVVAYSGFFLCSLGFAILTGIVCLTAVKGEGAYMIVFLLYPHMFFINPIVTFISVLALPAQFPYIGERLPQSRSALSPNSLLLQSVVFTIVGVSWAFRLTAANNNDLAQDSWSKWFVLKGWAVLDNVIFAFVQGALYTIMRVKCPAEEEGEVSSLLH